MDIFIYGIPIQTRVKDLDEFLRDPLRRLGIELYHCIKMNGKGCALLTLLHDREGVLFLGQHGPSLDDPRSPPLVQLIFQGNRMHCRKAKEPSDEFILRSLRSKESQRSSTNVQPNLNIESKSPRRFDIKSIACGLLEFAGQDPVFLPYYSDTRSGSITFGQKALVINLVPSTANLASLSTGVSLAAVPQILSSTRKAEHILISHHSVEFIGTGSYENPTITLSLRWAPQFYKQYQPDLLQSMTDLSLHPQSNHTRGPKFKYSRLTSIDDVHASVAGTCFVYRVQLADRFDVSQVHQMLKRDPSPPSNLPWVPRTLTPLSSFASQMTHLNQQLASASRWRDLDFAIKYQMQRLAQNGLVPPMQVVDLLSRISSVARLCGTEKTAEALRMLARDLPFLEPHTSPDELSTKTLEEQIEEYATKYSRAGSVYELRERHPHIVLIYRAQVTPSGIYLSGPNQDVTNRVLRKYSDHLDHFMRVEFIDDTGYPIKFDKNGSLESIFQGRFKHVLSAGINIAGRKYEFLGFSHSSLREQSAWFLAPFWHGPTQELTVPAVIIGRLGEFSHFRSPARCAARIGQAFSDTTGSIHLGRHGYTTIQDIEKVEYVYEDGRIDSLLRNFSDGVGTLSWKLLHSIWSQHQISRVLKATVLQIRFAGAKGMISLDSRLEGKVLNLRDSMIKFESKEDWDIEICGEATRPLPMFLNRSLIKVLEDLGVEANAFLRLQAGRIDELRTLMKHPINAEKFLDENRIGRSTQVPWLIRMLNEIGLLYQGDDFLSRFVEMGILHQLREMKYRGRIRLDRTQGITLFGIMDETGYLNEGEIYVPIERRGEGRHVLEGGTVAITRSPALHPGDVQRVRAVDVPDDSPLNSLYNCVVFSSKGTRDLPSQLSGGDLDGDQYHIIFAAELLPTRAYPAANYPRVAPIDIGRTVQTADMSNFFVEFMENDRLGQISNLHLQLADQRELGVMDRDCIKLAGLASTAVDFSKTGIPANMTTLPKRSKCRPDFMAPGPRIRIQDRPEIDADEDSEGKDDLLSQEDAGYVYYPSQKALGKLYRAIDESKFLDEIRQDAKNTPTPLPGDTLMKTLWDYVKRYTILVQWNHLRGSAKEIRECYEENLINMMYEYSMIPHQPLTEIEVVTGIIFGRNEGVQSKRIREISREMKEHFDRDVEFTIRRITRAEGEDEETSEDALALATACFNIAMEKPGRITKRTGEMKSFRYIAAALCLKEIKKVQPNGLLM